MRPTVVLLLIIAAALSTAGGCTSGQWMTPGGVTEYNLIRSHNGDVVAKLRLADDAKATGVKLDAATGKAEMASIDRNSSNLAVIQAQAVVAQIQANAELAKELSGLAKGLMSLYAAGAGGGITIPTTGGGTTTGDTDAQKALRAAIIAKIDNCPILATNPVQQAKLHDWVAGLPAAYLPLAEQVANSLSLTPVQATKPR